jgi:DNA adenine methylase
MEVVNDINGELITFYRCVRFHADVLLTELEFVLNSRQEFYDFRDQPGLTDIQRAARWFFRNKISFGGQMDSFGTGALGGGSSHGSRANRMEVIRALNLRLDRVCIEHLSWEKCLTLYDRPSTFFFLDPPYTGCGATTYKAWTDTDVRILRNKIDKLRGKWLVTLNDNAANRKIFSGCKIRSVDRAMGINNQGDTAKRYKELIITPR